MAVLRVAGDRGKLGRERGAVVSVDAEEVGEDAEEGADEDEGERPAIGAGKEKGRGRNEGVRPRHPLSSSSVLLPALLLHPLNRSFCSRVGRLLNSQERVAAAVKDEAWNSSTSNHRAVSHAYFSLSLSLSPVIGSG